MWETAGNLAVKILSNKWFWIILLIVVIILAIYFYGKSKGSVPRVANPNSGRDIPAGWSPQPLASSLHNVLSGLFTMTGTKDAVFSSIINLPNDAMVISVGNAFNDLYFKEGKGSIINWLKDELWVDPLTGKRDELVRTLERVGFTGK